MAAQPALRGIVGEAAYDAASYLIPIDPKALLESRDHGFFVVDVPNFWERPELADYLRDVQARQIRLAAIGERFAASC